MYLVLPEFLKVVLESLVLVLKMGLLVVVVLELLVLRLALKAE